MLIVLSFLIANAIIPVPINAIIVFFFSSPTAQQTKRDKLLVCVSVIGGAVTWIVLNLVAVAEGIGGIVKNFREVPF